MNRAERRRLEREIENTKPIPGLNQGWRLSAPSQHLYNNGIPLKYLKKYSVKELTYPIDIDKLEIDSINAQQRMGIIINID